MSYQIELSRRAEKQLEKIPQQFQGRIRDKINTLAQEPRPTGVKKLQGTEENVYRIRVGAYRILYEIQDRALIVLVIKVAHRRDVYRT